VAAITHSLQLADVLVPPAHAAGLPWAAAYSGATPCRRPGRSTRPPSARSSARMIVGRVSRGSMTSSIHAVARRDVHVDHLAVGRHDPLPHGLALRGRCGLDLAAMEHLHGTLRAMTEISAVGQATIRSGSNARPHIT
jgi:hypothetical protein